MSDNTGPGKPTESLLGDSPAARLSHPPRQFRLTVLEGPGKGETCQSTASTLSIGSHGRNDLVLEDPAISRFHCEVRAEDDGARLRDLESRNGTTLDGVRVVEAYLRGRSHFRIGRSVIRFEFVGQGKPVRLSDAVHFGSLVGQSAVMRMTFALLERAAKSSSTVLLEGATGTGKEGAAVSLHDLGPRASKALIVIDCGAMPASLLESELFGHEKGAFTGATSARVGAFEEANGGTIFLDEIGELPLELQPKLLRVLESGQIRRLGSNRHQNVDVRVLAATHRDLRLEVNDGRFREDLYYRLAVVRITMPSLRERPEDIELLSRRILGGLGADEATINELLTVDVLRDMRMAAWPGNVRELRNYLERALVLDDAITPASVLEVSGGPSVDAREPYAIVRRRVLDDFERRYTADLLALHDGNVSAASRAAGVDRGYIHRLIRRHSLK